MATIQPGERYTARAGADLTGKRYHIVKLNASDEAVLSSAATDAHFGVLDYEAKAGDSVDIVMLNGSGTFKVKTAANIAAGALITSNASGQAITATTGARVIGRALRASVAGEVAEYIKLDSAVAAA